MLSVNLCGQLIPIQKPPFSFLHKHHLFLNKTPNFYQFLRYQRFPSSIYCHLRYPQTVKDSLADEQPQKEEQVELYTVNYLINACGLSDGEAFSTAKKLMVRNKRLSKNNRAANADALLALLREHGLSRTQISMIVKRHPLILIAHPYENILPKLVFFQSIGFTRGAYLAEVISRYPEILATSLKHKLIPNYNVLKDVLDSNHELIHATWKKNMRIMQADGTSNVVPNVELLRDAGVSKTRITFLVVNYPLTVKEKHSQFKQAVIQLKEMGFDPSNEKYIYGVVALLQKSKLLWNQSYEKFLELGCSKDEIFSEFRMRPLCMLVSVEKINKVMERLVKNMGWPHSDIANKPYLFRHSLEKKIIPRCSVVLFLHSKGLLVKLPKMSSTVEVSVDYFINRYVTRYAEVVPEVLRIYKGELNFLGEYEK